MNCRSPSLRAQRWSLAVSLVAAIGGLAACSPNDAEEDGAAGAAGAGDLLEAAAAPLGRPPPRDAPCRRWTTCVPENPCHTGWVTGCRANVPICTDIGGWLSNGSTCGDDAVCYLGDCTPCSAGDACQPLDSGGNSILCRAGVTSCDTGQQVCLETGPAPDGADCWPGSAPVYVCTGGACTYCIEGMDCMSPEAPCRVGVQSCSGGAVCTPTEATRPDGYWCGDGKSCFQGTCIACSPGASCDLEGQPCSWGGISCSSGAPVCEPQGFKWVDTPCGDGLLCDGAGSCVPPCVGGAACDAGACMNGSMYCYGSVAGYCQPTTPKTDGTACGDQMICLGGSCTGCNTPCNSPDACHSAGALSCTTGLCESSGDPLLDGTVCGVDGETCQAGTCTGVPGSAIVVRSAGGFVDLTGTAWEQCDSSLPEPGLSERRSMHFVTGGFQIAEDAYATPDCTGEPTSHVEFPVSVVTAGDRRVTWTSPWPPDGLPWEVQATAVRVTGFDPRTLQSFDFKSVLFVGDGSWPRRIFEGEKDRAIAADGYPTLLSDYGKTEVGAVCVPTGPCPPPGGECLSWGPECFGGIEMCMALMPLPNGTPCPGGVCWYGGCNPTSDVTGTRSITLWPDAGAMAPYAPNDLPWISAYWPDAGGLYLPGTLGGDGSFSIGGVPAGRYVLSFVRGVPYFVETDARTVDLSEDLLGRDGLVVPGIPTPVDVALSELAPFSSGDHLHLLCGNTSMSTAPFGSPATGVAEGSTSAVGVVDWARLPLLDAARDTAYAFQMTTTALTGTAVTWKVANRWGPVSPITLVAGEGNPLLTATLGEPTSSGALTTPWPMLAYQGHLQEVSPSALVQVQRLAVTAKPYVTPAAGPSALPLMGQVPTMLALARLTGAQAADLDVAGATYGRFLPAHWTEYRDIRMGASVTIALPDRPSVTFGGWIHRIDPLSDGVPAPAAEPAVTPPLAPMITAFGMATDAFYPQWGVSTGPQLSWLPPASGAPTTYAVLIYSVSDTTPATQALEAVAVTPSTSFKFPEGLLQYGRAYFAVIIARSSETERSDAPLRGQFDADTATAVTAGFTP